MRNRLTRCSINTIRGIPRNITKARYLTRAIRTRPNGSVQPYSPILGNRGFAWSYRLGTYAPNKALLSIIANPIFLEQVEFDRYVLGGNIPMDGNM